MKLPTPEQLGVIASMIADGRSDTGRRFADLGPQARLDVMRIAQAGVLAEVLDSLPVNIDVGIAETIAGLPVSKLLGHLDDIDTRLSVIAEWFEKSKLYEP